MSKAFSKIFYIQGLLSLIMLICPVVKANNFALNIYKEDNNGCNLGGNDYIATAMKKGWLYSGYLFQYMIDDSYKFQYTVGDGRRAGEAQDELLGISQCDMSICMLEQIFGSIPGLLGTVDGVPCPDANGSVGPKIIRTMFSYFNVGMLTILYVFIGFAVLNVILVGGYEGSFTEKQLSLVAAMRICVSAILMIPTSSGYTYLQILIMYIFLNGIGFADRAFSNALFAFDQQLNQKLIGIETNMISQSTGTTTDSSSSTTTDVDSKNKAYQSFYDANFLSALRIYMCGYYNATIDAIPDSGTFEMQANPPTTVDLTECGSVSFSGSAGSGATEMLKNVSYNMLYSAYKYYYNKSAWMNTSTMASEFTETNADGSMAAANVNFTSLGAYGSCLLCRDVKGIINQYYVVSGQSMYTSSELGGQRNIAICTPQITPNTYNGSLPLRKTYIGDELQKTTYTNENSVLDQSTGEISWAFCRYNVPSKVNNVSYSGCLLNLASYINSQVSNNGVITFQNGTYKDNAIIGISDDTSAGQVEIENDCSNPFFGNATGNALRSKLAITQAYRNLVRELTKNGGYESRVYKLLQDYNTTEQVNTPTSSASYTVTNTEGEEEFIKVSNIDNVISKILKPFYASRNERPFFDKIGEGLFVRAGVVLNPAQLNLQTTVLMIAEKMFGVPLQTGSYANYPTAHPCMYNTYNSYCNANINNCYENMRNAGCLIEGVGLFGAYAAIKNNKSYNPFKDFVGLGMTIMQSAGLYLINTNILLFLSSRNSISWLAIYPNLFCMTYLLIVNA